MRGIVTEEGLTAIGRLTGDGGRWWWGGMGCVERGVGCRRMGMGGGGGCFAVRTDSLGCWIIVIPLCQCMHCAAPSGV